MNQDAKNLKAAASGALLFLLMGASPFQCGGTSNGSLGSVNGGGGTTPTASPSATPSSAPGASTPTGPDCGVALPTTTAARQIWLSAKALAATLTNGQPVATWSECSSTSKNADQSAGTSQPAFATAGGPGGAASVNFDGVNDFVRVPTASMDFTGGLTAVAVLYLDTGGSGTLASGRGVLSKGYDCTGSGNCFQISTDTFSGNNLFYMWSKNLAVGGSSGVLVDSWTIATAMIDGGTGAIASYFNGAVGSQGTGMSYATNSEDLVIGAAQTGVGSYAAAKIRVAEFALFKGALSNTDRVAVECAFKARYSGLPAYSGTCP